MKQSQTISEFLASYCQANKVNVKSLVSSLFGDLVVPNGGKVWVETIASLMAPLGINGRLVRTTLFRLSEEGWLSSTRSGRKSYYELTGTAKSQTELAEKVIYHADQKDWDGEWTLVFIVMEPVEKEARRQLEKELAWIGFGAVTKHIVAHPTVTPELVADRVCSLGLQNSVVCMRARNLSEANLGFKVSDRDMADQCFPVQELAAQYQVFIDTFSDIFSSSAMAASSGQPELVSLRLLLVDCYRRIALHDPHLPSELLPEQWIGDKAYRVFKEGYTLLHSDTENTYKQLLENAGSGLTNGADGQRMRRFSD